MLFPKEERRKEIKERGRERERKKREDKPKKNSSRSMQVDPSR